MVSFNYGDSRERAVDLDHSEQLPDSNSNCMIRQVFIFCCSCLSLFLLRFSEY